MEGYTMGSTRGVGEDEPVGLFVEETLGGMENEGEAVGVPVGKEEGDPVAVGEEEEPVAVPDTETLEEEEEDTEGVGVERGVIV
jgi:hypothetical protein